MFRIKKSNRKNKKFVAIFDDDEVIHFGDSRYEDYTQHHDIKRKHRYIQRHQNQDWSDPKKAGTLSRYILWDTQNIDRNIERYKKRFNLN